MRFVLIFGGILFLLYWLPLGVRALYQSGDAGVWLLIGPLRLKLLPKKKKKKAEKEKDTVAIKVKTPKPAKEKEKEKKGGSLRDFLPLLEVAKDALGSFRRKLRIRRLELKLVMAGNDPCDLAVNYGRAWAAVGNILPRLEAIFVIKKRNVEVECDFTASETTIYVLADITMTLGRLLGIAVKYGIRALRAYLTLRKKRKGSK